MKCPYCGKDNTRVIDSRPADDGDSIRRRRECDECHKRFTTYEKVETIPMIVIKKDNNRETYDRAKVEGGVFRACHKRPVSAAQIEAMIDDVESSIFSKEEREISSRQIGEMVMEKLKEAYAAVNPDVEIEVQQSDSTTGMTSAIEGVCDIGIASRDLKDSELEAGLTPTVIAMDGIAVVVNNDSPVTELTSENVKDIFTGEITDWADVQ